MELREARDFALSLPGASEQPHFDSSSFRVGTRIFATVPADGTHLHLFVDESDVLAGVAEDPSAFEELWWGRQLRGLRVCIAVARADRVCELLEEAWRRKAPKRVVAAFDAGRQG